MCTEKEKEAWMRLPWLLLVGLLSATIAPAGQARSDGDSDKLGTRNGGQMHVAGPYRLELVVGERELALHVTDQGNAPVDTTGGSVKAIITGGKDRYVVILSPAGGNVLRGAGDYQLGAYNLISLMLALPEQELQHAKFVHPKGAKPPPKKAKKKSKAKKSTKKKPAAKKP
jgi:hypothetical protein